MTAPPDIRASADGRRPAGPSLLPRLLTGREFRQGPIEFLSECAARHGDLVYYRSPSGPIFVFNHPTLIQEIVVDHERDNRRVLTMQRARSLLGDGLLTSEEPLHMRQRRMAAPAFHRQRIAAYGDVIAHYAAEITSRWQPGLLDVHPDMLLIALRIVGKCLFDIDSEDECRQISTAVRAFVGGPPPPAFIPTAVLDLLQKIPFGPILRVRKGIDDLDRIIYQLIAKRRHSPGDRGDLLSMLLAAEDSEPSDGPEAFAAARSMSDKQVRDECFTIILAGHETIANALSFALSLLSQHPEDQEELHREALQVLGPTRPPTAADYPQLRFAWMVFAESMRLLPTVWVLGRSCGPEPYDFHGFTIPPGATLLAPQILVHRDPRFWNEPDRFLPRRFDEEGKSSRPKFAYFPFGGGSRQCIGEGLAWMEGVFVLATILRDWRVSPVPGAPTALPTVASINLRPKNGVPLLLERR